MNLDFEAVESDLLTRADAGTDTPADLQIPVDEIPDREQLQLLAAWLLDRGWRIAVDDLGELWFYAPGPLTDPGDIARGLN